MLVELSCHSQSTDISADRRIAFLEYTVFCHLWWILGLFFFFKVISVPRVGLELNDSKIKSPVLY